MRAFIVFCLLALQMPLAFAWSGVVERVIDGNTVRVRHESGKLYDVKLYGVQCPGLSQPRGAEAREAARKLVDDKSVEITPITLDSSKRMVAVVAINDQYTLQAFLVGRGMAWVHESQCDIKSCSRWSTMQTQARNSRQGLWADARPVAPWRWTDQKAVSGKAKTRRIKKRTKTVVRKKKVAVKASAPEATPVTVRENTPVLPKASITQPASKPTTVSP